MDRHCQARARQPVDVDGAERVVNHAVGHTHAHGRDVGRLHGGASWQVTGDLKYLLLGGHNLVQDGEHPESREDAKPAADPQARIHPPSRSKGTCG